MTEQQKTATGLLDALDKERALSHIAFVLSPAFGLTKPHLRTFWMQVRIEVMAYSASREYKAFSDTL